MTERSDIMLVATAGRRKMWKFCTIVSGGDSDEGSAEEQSGDWRANDDDANEQRRENRVTKGSKEP